MFRITSGAFIALATACGSATVPASTPSAEPAPAETESGADAARKVCEAVMVRTRECGELYVPALLRTRARFDHPPGIAKRYAAEGEERLLPIARAEFKQDWSDEGIDKHCGELLDKPEEERDAIVKREKSCLGAAGDCQAFVDCNMQLLERRWAPEAGAPNGP